MSVPVPDRPALEEERDLLLASLRDLEREHEAGDIDDHDYENLRDDYTARAASVLRALERDLVLPSDSGPTPGPRRSGMRKAGGGLGRALAGDPATATAGGSGRSPRAPVSGRRRSRAGMLSAFVVVGILAVAGVAVVVSSGDRSPGDPITGSLPDSGGTTTAPSPIEARLEEAIALDREGQAVAALRIYDEILTTEPDNPDALAYRGWLLKRVSGGVEDPEERRRLVDEAMVALDRAVAVAPDYPDAHFFRGMVLLQDRADPAGAVREFEAFLANDPPAAMVPSVQAVLDQARAQAGG